METQLSTKKRGKRRVAFGTAIALTVSVCAATPALANEPAESEVSSAAIEISGSSVHEEGRDFVSSFFLGSGALTEELSEIPSLSGLEELYATEKSPEQQEAIDLILDEVDAADPGLYERVGEQVQSGDPYLVDAALEEASAAITNQISEIATEVSEVSDLSGKGIKNPGMSPQLAVVVLVVFHAGAAVTGVVVAAVGAAVVAGALFWTNGKSMNVSPATRQAMVSDLTTALE